MYYVENYTVWCSAVYREFYIFGLSTLGPWETPIGPLYHDTVSGTCQTFVIPADNVIFFCPYQWYKKITHSLNLHYAESLGMCARLTIAGSSAVVPRNPIFFFRFSAKFLDFLPHLDFLLYKLELTRKVLFA